MLSCWYPSQALENAMECGVEIDVPKSSLNDLEGEQCKDFIR